MTLSLLIAAVCVIDVTALAAETPATQPRHTNRLAKEKSPYLLQHAHNPVDWYPWGEEAFAKAKAEKKPILLSIGYSTCHWCHVMERESFENEAIAKLINENYIAIKLDREERPDVDRIYMTFVQATTGSGGWPMTVFLTPDRKPFFGGTYFPPETRGEMVGFTTILTKIGQLWRDEQQKVTESADRVTDMLRQATAGEPAAGGDVAVSRLVFTAAFNRLQTTFDEKWGGFGTAPKFPEPPTLQFLSHYAHTAPEDANRTAARKMYLATLDGMARGGIYDHLGGGFHRYSTDPRWFLPHFEKMLYDQGQLAGVYIDGYRMTGDARYADIARGILDYVTRDLTGPDGQFYCAEDADSVRPGGSAKAEGAFYVWSAGDIESLFGAAKAKPILSHFGMQPGGNVEHDPRNYFPKLNVLFLAQTIEESAKQGGIEPGEMKSILNAAKSKMLAERGKRPRPHLDDKTLASWSGLMISGFAKAGAALQEQRYLDAAVKSAGFIRERLYDAKTGILKRRYRQGETQVDGLLEDYSYMTQGLLDLYEATLDHQWLAWAASLQQTQDKLFWDDKSGGYFSSGDADPNLLFRMKDESDGAEPAGNSVAAMNLHRLSQMTDTPAMREKAKKTIASASGRMRQSPLALPYMLTAADFDMGKPRQIVIAGDPASPEAKALLAEVQKRYLPNRIILAADGGAGQAWLGEKLAFIKEMKPINGKPAAYVCQNYTCQQPTTDPAELARSLSTVLGGEGRGEGPSGDGRGPQVERK
ncbi:thioredoxin domain-containing protein [Humisphaera borealis]|uniref:Thioredoxin domain-containing protein n=1 Tax=Humisphaera borealis TaxID=2807512 RepID=A0A7M2X0U0_9BACT|nr:thioredoxin domain-containing protein [Humisphaera borealis]QOV91274.1 thioredoxin domain-containing protein [Humisphaera borealis]